MKDDAETIKLNHGDSAVVWRADGGVEGFAFHDGEWVDEGSSAFWAYATLLVFGHGDEPETMRSTLMAWFNRLCDEKKEQLASGEDM